MTLLDPIADLARWRQQFDRVFPDLGAVTSPEAGRMWRPAADIYQDEDAVTVVLDVPGVNESAIDVHLEGEDLIIRGERAAGGTAGGCVHAERPGGPFHRAFRVTLPLKGDEVTASVSHGVLTVRLPKADAIKPRRVPVTATPDG
jgi:HSP20 family protein